ncbi:MAG: YHS domain-containing protein [Phycisphaera sp.]|nr:YHS domain-containing protein [Phycisphaera sp.]
MNLTRTTQTLAKLGTCVLGCALCLTVAALLTACGNSSSPPAQSSTGHSMDAMKGAAQDAVAAGQAAADAVKDAAEDAVAVNAKCPVSGDPIDAKGAKVVYDGKVYGFCCDDCIKAFKANPAKYAKAQ